MKALKIAVMLSLLAGYLSAFELEVISDPDLGSVYIIKDLHGDLPGTLFALGRETFVDVVAALEEKALLEKDYQAQLRYSERLHDDLLQTRKALEAKERLLRFTPWLVAASVLTTTLVFTLTRR